MELIDIIVFATYCLVILSIGLYISRDKKGHQKRRGKERVENKYKEKSVIERKSIVEYFSLYSAT